jgi:hypothetical protein
VVPGGALSVTAVLLKGSAGTVATLGTAGGGGGGIGTVGSSIEDGGGGTAMLGGGGGGDGGLSSICKKLMFRGRPATVYGYLLIDPGSSQSQVVLRFFFSISQIFHVPVSRNSEGRIYKAKYSTYSGLKLCSKSFFCTNFSFGVPHISQDTRAYSLEFSHSGQGHGGLFLGSM